MRLKNVRCPHILLLMFLACTSRTTEPSAKNMTAEQALATVGYLAEKEKKKVQLNILQEDLWLFIKKVVLIAMRKINEPYHSLYKLDERMRRGLKDIEMELLLNALNEAAYIIKNRAEACCSAAEIRRLTAELQRWCDWATSLVHAGHTDEKGENADSHEDL